MNFKLQNDVLGVPYAVIKNDGWIIPFAPDNTDYQAYLKWVADGNTPLPADSQLKE